LCGATPSAGIATPTRRHSSALARPKRSRSDVTEGPSPGLQTPQARVQAKRVSGARRKVTEWSSPMGNNNMPKMRARWAWACRCW
jgi:hypothetical protein